MVDTNTIFPSDKYRHARMYPCEYCKAIIEFEKQSFISQLSLAHWNRSFYYSNRKYLNYRSTFRQIDVSFKNAMPAGIATWCQYLRTANGINRPNVIITCTTIRVFRFSPQCAIISLKSNDSNVKCERAQFI